jgi:outer membrane protein assembly factor BamB
MRTSPGSQSADAAPNPRRETLRRAALLSMTTLIAAVALGLQRGNRPGSRRRGRGRMDAAQWQLREHTRRQLRDQLRQRELAQRHVDTAADRVGPIRRICLDAAISADGVTYVRDLASNVMAYDLATGKQLWRVDYNSPTVGPNGLAFEDGILFGVTSTDVFAIDAKSGQEIWKKHVVDQPPGVADGQGIGLTIQPAVRNGELRLSEAATSGGGQVFAFDAKTGAQLWTFDTTTAPASDKTPAGGSWNTPFVDAGGNVYYSIGNGYYTPNSPKSVQNDRLYTDSLVKLDGKTGKLDWHYQAIANDFWDHDLQLSPMLADNNGQQLLVTGGKLGHVVAVDPNTGKQVWKTAVGTHN